MNNINLQQSGGFPLETETLNFMQSAYASLQAIAALGGERYILSGCIEQGGNVGDGFVFVAGEVLEFRGGAKLTNIVVRQEVESRPFENGQVKDVFYKRYATFGTDENQIPWASLVRLKTLDQFRNLPNETSSAIDLSSEVHLATAKAVKLLNDKIDILLKGKLIYMYSGPINAIPAGFVLCDGQNGTPDLRDKFILGAGNSYPVGAVGGEKDHMLTIAEMPEHDHIMPAQPTIDAPVTVGSSGSGNRVTPQYTNRTTGKAGGNAAHNNMPPYFALAFIMPIQNL